MLFIGGMRIKHMAMLGGLGVMAIPVLIFAEPYRIKRLTAFLNPWANPQGEGFQLIQSLYSLGAGGLFGVGLFNSKQKYLFLPFSESDFIFSIIGEEWGFVGSFIVIAIFFTIIFTIIHSAERQKDKFTRIFGYCIASYLFMHVFVNIGMTIGIMPVVGIPLPLISYGGSSFITFTILLFIYIKLDFDKWN